MSRRPYLSVVIPAYNEEKYIDRCIRALHLQKTSFPYEILVVDNSSQDNTVAIAQAYPCKIIQERTKGYCFAVSRGITSARGTIICLVDADTRVPPDWLQTIGQLFTRDNTLVCVGGPGQFYDGPRLLRKLFEWLTLLSMRVSLIQPMGFNIAFKKSAYYGISHNLDKTDLQWDRHLVVLLRDLGTIRFLSSLPVGISSRRWRSFPQILKEVTIRLCNVMSIEITRKKIFTSFDDYR